MKSRERIGIRARIGAAYRLLTSGKLPVQPALPSSELHARIADLEMDIQDRDHMIESLKKEYHLLKSRTASENANAGDAAVKDMLEKLSPLLSQLVTMRSIEKNGTQIKAKDLLKLFDKMEKVICEKGLEQIGDVGQETIFDGQVHQRLSGSSIQDGDVVGIRFPGYRFKNVFICNTHTSQDTAVVLRFAISFHISKKAF
ncbi:MAG: nucleotide exchange factor GrpE, partial [Desulfobacterales bacterium]|nr:nucleotide exchange factor GrpE [Desulfobacterales bacterium]